MVVERWSADFARDLLRFADELVQLAQLVVGGGDDEHGHLAEVLLAQLDHALELRPLAVQQLDAVVEHHLPGREGSGEV